MRLKLNAFETLCEICRINFRVGLDAIRLKSVEFRIKDAAGDHDHIGDVDKSDYANQSAANGVNILNETYVWLALDC